MFTTIVYTHSTYYDCLNLCISQLEKYKIRPIIFSNTQYRNYKTILYEDSLSYTDRLKSCLDKIEDNKILYLHEDFILYDKPDILEISKLSKWLDRGVDSIRLIRSGVPFLGTQIEDKLYTISNTSQNYVFAIQASLFKKEYLSHIVSMFPHNSIWDLETNCQKEASKFNNTVYCDSSLLRGISHYDSNIFPYTATAICKGKWNTEYKDELTKLFNIDFSNRGWA